MYRKEPDLGDDSTVDMAWHEDDRLGALEGAVRSGGRHILVVLSRRLEYPDRGIAPLDRDILDREPERGQSVHRPVEETGRQAMVLCDSEPVPFRLRLDLQER